MAVVSVEINGRAFPIACGDGEEEHVRRRAAELDQRVRLLAEAVGQVGDSLLLVMTGLLLADELAGARTVAVQAPDPPPLAPEVDEIDAACAQAVEALAARVDAIAERLGKA